MVSAVVITGIKPPVKIRPNKKLGITDELAKEINKYRLIKQEADILNKSLKSYGYDTAKQIKYDRYAKLYENHLEYLHNKPKTDVSDGKIKRQPYKVEMERDPILKEALKDVDNFDKGMTEEQVKEMWEAVKEPMTEAEKKAMDEIGRKYFERKGMKVATAVVATQTKPTRWTKTVVRKYNALQESLITTGRTWGATDLQLQKIMHMDPDKLWELGNAYKSYFDELFEYVETDIEYNMHGHPGLQKIIDKYEERYGEIVV